MGEHPYFTRSKDPKDSFSDQCLSKAKEILLRILTWIMLLWMTLSLLNRTIWFHSYSKRLMKWGLKCTRLDIWKNFLSLLKLLRWTTEGLHSIFLLQIQHLNISRAIPKPSIIDATTPSLEHASSSHQKSPTSQNPDTKILQNFPLNHHIPTQIFQIPPTTQPKPLKTTFHLPISPGLYAHLTTHFEPEHFDKKENDWMVRNVKT